jgi:hypothetical protein
MAKRTKKRAQQGARTRRERLRKFDALPGPYLQMAAICTDVLEERTDRGASHSLIRLVERIGVDKNPKAAAVPFRGFLFMTVKRGDSSADLAEVAIEAYTPTGRSLGAAPIPVQLPEGQLGGAAIKVKLGLEINELGVWTLELRLNGKPVSRLHLEVVMNRSLDGSEPASLAASGRA